MLHALRLSFLLLTVFMEIFVLLALLQVRKYAPFLLSVRYAARRVAAYADYMRKAENNPKFALELERGFVEIAVSLACVTGIAIITATNKQPLRHIPDS